MNTSNVMPSTTPDSNREPVVTVSRGDLMMLTKARLSFLVIMTTLAGFVLASRSGIDWILLLHTLVGASLAALGASVFNQLLEIENDARMRRTENRPLPAGRMPPALAFGLGWLLAAMGMVHLGIKVNVYAAYLAGLTLLVYLFIYTPMKRRSSLNTLVGAVSGAIPPLIGWAAAGGGFGLDAVFLFSLLFLWQLPHFLAINWMYREEYVKGGFVMWSNDDASGAKTSGLALIFSVLLTCLMFLPLLNGSAGWLFAAAGAGLSLVMVFLAVKFRRERNRAAARRLFFYTLVYLPVVLTLLVVLWK